MSRYFSQRFAQLPIRHWINQESDGMTLRVALGAKPTFSDEYGKQLIINTPIYNARGTNPQAISSQHILDMLYT
jgi:glutamate synthase (NADPH/NADH) large chain